MRAPGALVDAADQALYEAKSSGRNCVIGFTPAHDAFGVPVAVD